GSSGPAPDATASEATAAGPPSEAATARPPSEAPASGAPSSEELQTQVIDALRTCFDPEIPVNIYDLGLVYSIQVDPPGSVSIRMTLTSPMCPVAGSLPPEVEAKVRSVPGVSRSTVEVVWEPPWSPSMMS